MSTKSTYRQTFSRHGSQQLKRRIRSEFGLRFFDTNDREFLLHLLAFKLQEKEHGSLPRETHDRLLFIAARCRRSSQYVPRGSLNLLAGTMLTKRYLGKTYHILVTESGYECEGVSYPSLHKLGFAITGKHIATNWFFGLSSRQKIKDITR